MNTKIRCLLKGAVLVCLLWSLAVAAGSDKIPSELIGTWNWKSLTALKNGKPFGTVNMQPDQSKTTFNADGTWIIDTSIPSPHQFNGSYEVRAHNLEMKRSDGTPYAIYQFKIEKDGKQLLLQSSEQKIVATRR